VYARVAHLKGDPENIERGLALYEEQVLPWAREATGYRGWVVLLDREAGTALGLTFWATEEDMRRNEEAAQEFRSRLAAPMGVEIVAVDHYESIAFDPPTQT
jgi:hypothetical protein